MRLTAKLLLTFLLTALIPVAVLGYLSYGSAKQALQEQALEDLAVIAEAKEGHLYSFIDGIKGRAVDFNSDGFIRDSTEILESVDPEDPPYDATVSALNRHLKLNKMPLDKSIHMIAVIDLSGRIIASTAEGDIGRDESDDDYFIYGKKGVYVSDVHISPHVAASEHPYHIAVSAPLTGRETGALLGVIVNFYDTRELDKILSGEFRVEKGALSGEPVRRKTMEVYLVNEEKLMITASRFKDDVALKQRVESEPVQRCSNGEEMTGVYRNYLGVEVIGASRCIAQKNWILLAEISAEEAFAPVATLKDRALMLGAIVGFIVTFVALVAAREIAAPVTELARATKKLMRGDFMVRVKGRRLEGRDEIGDLTTSFNTMVEELKSSREAVVAEKSKLETTIRGMSEAVVFVDAMDNIALMNSPAERLFRVKKEELIGKNVLECPSHSAREAVMEMLEAFKKGDKQNVIAELRYKGRVFEVSHTAVWEQLRYLGTVLVANDVTERKEAEEKLREYAAQLEHSNQLKELFTDIMRHDLQNPVTVIKGLSSILGEGETPKSLRRELEMIRRNAEKLQEMIETASKYAKLEDAEEPDFQRLDLNETLREVIRGLKPLLKEKKMKLIYRGRGKKLAMVNP